MFAGSLLGTVYTLLAISLSLFMVLGVGCMMIIVLVTQGSQGSQNFFFFGEAMY